jgi:hypothetical protein
MKSIRLVLLAFLALPAAPAALAQVSSAAPMKATPTLTPLPVIAPVSRPAPTPIVVLPVTPKPDVAPIERKPILVKMPEKPAYKLQPEAGEVKFGDGERGRRPPSSRKPVATYRRGAGATGLPAVQKPGKLAPQGPVVVSPLDDPRVAKKDEGMGDDAQLSQRRLQMKMDKQAKEAASVSSMMKKQNDTNKAIIDKLK